MFPPSYHHLPDCTPPVQSSTSTILMNNIINNLHPIDILPDDTCSISTSFSSQQIHTASMTSVISLPEADDIHYVSDSDDSLDDFSDWVAIHSSSNSFPIYTEYSTSTIDPFHDHLGSPHKHDPTSLQSL
jgi:hypothetical protein